MKFGKASGCLDGDLNPFVDVYLGEILGAIAVAWARMKPTTRRGLEDQITLALAGRLRHDPEFAYLPFDVVPQYWLTNVDGRRLGRLDLHLKYRASRRDYVAFEAKRLHVRYPAGNVSTEYSVYTGGDGMGAFVEGHYSKGLPSTGMLAYVMDGETEKAWIGLGRSIHSNRDGLSLVVQCDLTESPLSNNIKPGLPGTRLW